MSKKLMHWKDLNAQDQFALRQFMAETNWWYDHRFELVTKFVTPFGSVNEFVNAWQREIMADPEVRAEAGANAIEPAKLGGWFRTVFAERIQELGRKGGKND